MIAVETELPLHTANPLNGSHRHWSVRAKARKEQRSAVVFKLRRFAREHLMGLTSYVVTLTRMAPSNGLDDDNLRAALKSVRDGVADVLALDDASPLITWRYEQRRGPWEVRIRIESPTDEDLS